MNKQIVQEAAEWFVEINADTPDPDLHVRFDRWLRASPEHVRAYLELVPIWEDGAHLTLPASSENSDAAIEQLVARTRDASNVSPLRSQESVQRLRDNVDHSVSRQGKPRRWRQIAALAAALAGVALIVGYQQTRHPEYVTRIGEQHSLVLPDNSMVQLDAVSNIQVRYSTSERAIQLLEGRALFQVAKNAARPFVVYSGGVRVRAVGTQFDVYRKSNRTIVTVVEGRVAVFTGAQQTDEPDATVSVGEQLVVSNGTLKKTEHPDLAGDLAWTRRQLVFDSMPLTDVAEEFNRYNTRRLIIEAAGIGDFRISGTFSSTDPSSLIRFLREQPGISVTESEQGIHVSGT
jgi:transmembrane sensor